MKLLHSVASIENFVHPWHYTSSSGGFSKRMTFNIKDRVRNAKTMKVIKA